MDSELFKSIDWQLQNDPPLISVVCFFGSLKCFNLLMALGADLYMKDKNGIYSYYFIECLFILRLFLVIFLFLMH